MIPDPNLPGTTSNFSFMNTSAHNDYIYTIKADHAFTQNHRFAFFMTRQSGYAVRQANRRCNRVSRVRIAGLGG